MSDIELISCIECGRTLSPFASRCPGCDTDKFKGTTCEICGKPGKASTIRKVEYIYKNYDSDYDFCTILKGYGFYHIHCHERVSTVSYTCYVCNEKINKFHYYCPRCAHPFKVLNCKNCHQNVLAELSVVSYDGKTLHRLCAEIENPNWEDVKIRFEQEKKRRFEEEENRKIREADERQKRLADRQREELARKRRETADKVVYLFTVILGMFIIVGLCYSFNKSLGTAVGLFFIAYLGLGLIVLVLNWMGYIDDSK